MEETDSLLDFKTISFTSKKIVGVIVKLTDSQTQNFILISNLWKRFNREVHRIENRSVTGKNWEKYGVMYRKKDDLLYLAGIEQKKQMVIPEDMKNVIIPSGTCACFEHIGKLNEITNTLQKSYSVLKFHPKKQGVIHFEKYDKRFHWNRLDSVIEIWIFLQKEVPQPTNKNQHNQTNI